MLLCYLFVIATTIGNAFGIRNSFAQEQQLQIQQPSLLTYDSPWSNNLLALCAHGMCNPSSDSGNLPTADPFNTQHHNANIRSSLTFTNSKNLVLSHSFVTDKVLGPDRFRFVTSYWTTPDTSNGVDVGTSANNTFLSANSLPPNQKLEVDTNEGPSTLAVVLQYEGVVHLTGITAALKLPTGFKATLPLTSDRNRFDIALSDYRGHIYPGQGIVLYFPMYVLKSAKVQLPVLGPLALHFLRTNQRSILFSRCITTEYVC